MFLIASETKNLCLAESCSSDLITFSAISIERSEIELVQEDKKVEEEILNRNIKSRAVNLLKNKTLNKEYKNLSANQELNADKLSELNKKTKARRGYI